MSKFISSAISLFFMSLFIILYSQGLAVSETGCDDPSSTIPGDYERCNPDWKPQWSPTNPQEINPGGFAVVTFEGGQLPYTWQISGAGFWFDDQHTQTSIVTDTISTTIYADNSTCGAAVIIVTDDCEAQSYRDLRSESEKLEWDEKYSADTVSPSGSVVVAVINGVPPYQWAVQGNDFSIANASTDGITNTLIAGPDACGTATVTVTDFCSDQVQGEVRSTNGQWQAYTPVSCMIPGEPNDGPGRRIVGGWRQRQGYRTYGGSSTGGCPNPNKCSSGFGNCRDGTCLQGLNCDPTWGCTQCIRDTYCDNMTVCPEAWYLCVNLQCPPPDDDSWREIYCRCSTGLWLDRWSCPP